MSVWDVGGLAAGLPSVEEDDEGAEDLKPLFGGQRSRR